MADSISSSLKTCTRCHKPKPHSDFDEDGRRRDNLYPYCKICKEKGIIVPPWMKECSRCGRILPPQDFFVTKKSKDGLSYYCKKCDAKSYIVRPYQPRTEKKCNKCHEVKLISEFSKDKYHSDRLDGNCKQCKNIYQRKPIPQGTKICSMCNEEKPFVDFHRDKECSTGFRGSCIKCESAVRSSERRRNYELKKMYGITSQEYDTILASQNGVCAICKQLNTVSRYGKILALHVDHCHQTGVVRGLLCSKCNTALGLIDESLIKLEAMHHYLEKWA